LKRRGEKRRGELKRRGEKRRLYIVKVTSTLGCGPYPGREPFLKRRCRLRKDRIDCGKEERNRRRRRKSKVV
jgi:hypothetical protein